MEQMACSNPVLYYEFVELLARKMPGEEVVAVGPTLLLIPDLLVGPGHPQLLPNWQHYKAYVSAFASWTKALVHLLTTSPSESVAELTAQNIACACEWMINQPQPLEDEAWGTENWFSWAATEETKQKAKPSSAQLLLLLLASRPITAAAWKVLGLKAKPRGRIKDKGPSRTQSSTKKSLKQSSSKGSSNSGCWMDMGGPSRSSDCEVQDKGRASTTGRVEGTGWASGLETGEQSSSRGGDLEVGGWRASGDGLTPGGREISGSSLETRPQRVSVARGSDVGPRASSCKVETGERTSCSRGMKTGGQSSSSGGVEVGDPAGGGTGLDVKKKAASRYADADTPSNSMARINSSSGIISQSMNSGDGMNRNESSSVGNGERRSSSSTTSAGGEAGGTDDSFSCPGDRMPRSALQLTTEHIRSMMESSPMLGKLLIVALEHLNCLYQWHQTSRWVDNSMPPTGTGGGGEQLPAAPGSSAGATVEQLLESLSVTSAAAPVIALPEAAAAGASGAGCGDKGGPSGRCDSTVGCGGSGTAAPAAGRGKVRPAATEKAEQLPKRLSTLPQCGLPAAVMQQINYICSNWSVSVLALEELPAGEAEQQQLLQELLGVFEVLQEEVPMPVGCGNPMCTDLGGGGIQSWRIRRPACGAMWCTTAAGSVRWRTGRGIRGCARGCKRSKMRMRGRSSRPGRRRDRLLIECIVNALGSCCAARAIWGCCSSVYTLPEAGNSETA